MLSLSLILIAGTTYAQGPWTPIATGAPHYNDGVMLQLTDGSVLVKTSSGGADAYGTTWDKLTPDIHGSYINGTWSTISPMQNTRLYFSTQVLKDGTVYVAGGEYGTGRNLGEWYNPLTDNWNFMSLTDPTDTFSDANSEILENGTVLQAVVNSAGSVSHKTYIFDPATGAYSDGPPTLGIDNESAWVKLPDNSVLYVDIYSTNSERYIQSTNTWIHDASVPVELYDAYGYETGAAFLLPDRRAFFIGSSNSTAYYTPSGTTAPGTWTAGPHIPDSLGAPDAAAAMMVNGHILCSFSHTPVADTVFFSPTAFYDYDYTIDSFRQVLAPGILSLDTLSAPSYQSNMLCLPDGTVLYATQGNDQYYVYTPSSPALAAGKPTVTNIIKVNCDTFIATGKLFNGITEGAAYGDDWQMASNYPLVRISRNDTVYYALSFNWNSTGVRRDSLSDSTHFAIPDGALTPGTYSLQVVANGNASDPVPFEVCSVLGVTPTPVATNNINVYPNPAGKQVTIDFTAKAAGDCNVKLVDIFGRTVREKASAANAGSNTYQFSLDGVAKGIYTIIIRDGTGVYDTKLVVE